MNDATPTGAIRDPIIVAEVSGRSVRWVGKPSLRLALPRPTIGPESSVNVAMLGRSVDVSPLESTASKPHADRERFELALVRLETEVGALEEGR